MRKIEKQLYGRMIAAMILVFAGFGCVALAAAFDSGGGFSIWDGIGCCFFVFMILALIILIRIFGAAMMTGVLKKNLKNLKTVPKAYFVLIKGETSEDYIRRVSELAVSQKFEDVKEISLPEKNYRFFLRKHFWTLDSTSYHIHIAKIENSKIADYFTAVAQTELELNYGKFKGHYSAILAACVVEDFVNMPQMQEMLNDIIYVRGIAVVRAVVDIKNKLLYTGLNNASMTSRRANRLISKFLLGTKEKLKNCEGNVLEGGDNSEKIKEIEKKLDEMNLVDFRKNKKIQYAETFQIFETLQDGAFSFVKNEETGEAQIYYKEKGRGVFMDAELNEKEKTCGLYDFKTIKFIYPKKEKILKDDLFYILKKTAAYVGGYGYKLNLVFVEYSQINGSFLTANAEVADLSKEDFEKL